VPNKQPEVLSSAVPYSGKLVTLRVDQVRFESGATGERVVVSHPGATVILAINGDGRILWIRQNRYAIGRELLELPAGGLEAGEPPDVCAARELAEETGYTGTVTALGAFFTVPGFCTERLYAFLATNLRPHNVAGDEDEDITVVPLTLEESLARVDSGEIEDAKSLSTLFLYLRKSVNS
jgi:ADP-ribose pyrophosphatase